MLFQLNYLISIINCRHPVETTWFPVEYYSIWVKKISNNIYILIFKIYLPIHYLIIMHTEQWNRGCEFFYDLFEDISRHKYDNFVCLLTRAPI